MKDITYHRNPTAFEIKMGYGAMHYKDFPFGFCWDYLNDRPKRWVKCPVDGLRYYY